MQKCATVRHMARNRGIFERPKGSGIWWIDYRDANHLRHRERVGPKRTAIALYEKRKQDVREGKFFGVHGNAGPTFREIAAERLESGKSHLRPESIRTDDQRIKPLLTIFGNRPAASITSREIDAFLSRLVEERSDHRARTPATANRYRALIGKIFRYAKRDRRIAEDPMQQVPRRKESPGRVRWLTAEEEHALRSEIRANFPEREPEFDLALNTGMRRGEQYGLKRTGVDLINGILTITGKTGERRIELNSIARTVVETLMLRNPDQTIVQKREGGAWFETCVRKAGIVHFRWHDLRHTFASRLVMAGEDIRTVQELLGHKSITMTMKYAHLSSAHRRAAVESLVGVPQCKDPET